MQTLISNRTTEDSETRHSLDTAKVLAECCDQNSVCRIQQIQSCFTNRAFFTAIHPQGVELRVTTLEGDEAVLQEAICCISFPLKSALCAFLGCIVDVRQQKSGERRVVSTVPKKLMVTNLRQSFRVPVIHQAGLQCVAHASDGRKIHVKSRDISEAGIELELSQDDKRSLAVGQILSVEIRFRDEIVRLSAQVRHITGSRTGLMFIDPKDPEEHDQSVRLHNMVLAVQQLWLKNRITS